MKIIMQGRIIHLYAGNFLGRGPLASSNNRGEEPPVLEKSKEFARSIKDLCEIFPKSEAAIYKCEVIVLLGTRQVNTFSAPGALYHPI